MRISDWSSDVCSSDLQVYDAWVKDGKDVSAYDRARLMSVDYDGTELGDEADDRIRSFQRDAAKRAGNFHHLITLPTDPTAAMRTEERRGGKEGVRTCRSR